MPGDILRSLGPLRTGLDVAAQGVVHHIGMQVEAEGAGGGDNLSQLPHQRMHRATRNSEATQRDQTVIACTRR